MPGEAQGGATALRSDCLNRFLGMGPGTYLRQRRLSAARHELLTARLRAETVTEVAFRWGFWDLSRFARVPVRDGAPEPVTIPVCGGRPTRSRRRKLRESGSHPVGLVEGAEPLEDLGGSLQVLARRGHLALPSADPPEGNVGEGQLILHPVGCQQ